LRIAGKGIQKNFNPSKDSLTSSRFKPNNEPITFGMAKGNAKKKIDETQAEAPFLNEGNSNHRYNQEPASKRMGLYNFSNACYQLAVIQCLYTVQALVDHLRAQRSRVLRDAKLTGLGDDNFARSHRVKVIKNIFKRSKALMYVPRNPANLHTH
jgi:ubiquitin C-terminal hydrolase